VYQKSMLQCTRGDLPQPRGRVHPGPMSLNAVIETDSVPAELASKSTSILLPRARARGNLRPSFLRCLEKVCSLYKETAKLTSADFAC
jgi:hypothetical protein